MNISDLRQKDYVRLTDKGLKLLEQRFAITLDNKVVKLVKIYAVRTDVLPHIYNIEIESTSLPPKRYMVSINGKGEFLWDDLTMRDVIVFEA